MIIKGFPIVFGQRSVDLGGFREHIAPSAADRTLRNRADVVALKNHDSNHPLGRVSAGTLALAKDPHGLGIAISVDESVSYANDLIRIIQRGDAVGGSFGFRAIDDIWSLEDGQPLREVLDMSISEISVGVAFPAYKGTRLMAARSVVVPKQKILTRDHFPTRSLEYLQRVHRQRMATRL